MKLRGYAIVSLTYTAVALVVCIVMRALHDAEHTTLALLLAAMVSIYVGVFLWHRDSPTTSLSRVSLVLGVVLMILGTVCGLVFHTAFGWIEYPQVEIPVSAVGNFVGAFVLLPSVWRTVRKASETNDKDVSAGQ